MDRGNESKAAPISPIDRIVGVLKLGTPTTSLNHTYVKGESLYFPTGRVYGGQVIAQSVVAAARTVEESRLPESIHGLFITAGDIGQDILFDVENLRDGRSFSSRRVNATQRDGAVFTAISNFQEKGQDGFHYQDPMPDDLPAPESLPSMYDLMSPYQEESPFADYYTNQSPFDIRHITSVVLMHRERDAQARRDRQMVWMKAGWPCGGRSGDSQGALGLGLRSAHDGANHPPLRLQLPGSRDFFRLARPFHVVV